MKTHCYWCQRIPTKIEQVDAASYRVECSCGARGPLAGSLWGARMKWDKEVPHDMHCPGGLTDNSHLYLG